PSGPAFRPARSHPGARAATGHRAPWRSGAGAARRGPSLRRGPGPRQCAPPSTARRAPRAGQGWLRGWEWGVRSAGLRARPADHAARPGVQGKLRRGAWPPATALARVCRYPAWRMIFWSLGVLVVRTRPGSVRCEWRGILEVDNPRLAAYITPLMSPQ